LIPDNTLRKSIVAELLSHYAVNDLVDFAPLEKISNEFLPDIVICHESLIEDQQASKLAQLKTIFPNTRVLVIGPSRPIVTQITALKFGARGYFDETLPFVKLLEALELVANGEVWVERHVISGLIDEISEVPMVTPAQQMALDSLSPKELEVAKQVSYGATNKMIAKSMDITERTVKAHLTTIFNKLSLPDRLSLAIFFRDLRG
jgi:DNA-binding NarL/FixJ family response regulator